MARRTRLAPKSSSGANGAVTRRSAHPLAWKRGLRLADDDASRLEVLDDGAVLVHRAGTRKRPTTP